MKAQSAIELVILISVVLLFFSIFSIMIRENIATKKAIQKYERLQDLASFIQQELILASEAENGYERKFFLPEKIAIEKYSITIDKNTLFVSTKNHAIMLPIPSFFGEIKKGSNIIRKQDGKIYVNK